MAQEDRHRWDRRYASDEEANLEPPAWLEDLAAEIPSKGRALDVAAGTGRVALWLARRGLRVTAVDVSPVGLARCRRNALREGLEVETAEADLEETPLPPGPWDVIACFHYLQRDLFGAIRQALSPGGVFVCEIGIKRNLERHARPSERFLLDDNELLRLCAPLSIVYYREGWDGDRADARVLARRPAASAPLV